jgi:hypothetical protein
MAGSYTTLHSPALREGQGRSVTECQLFLGLTITGLPVVFHFSARLRMVVPNWCTVAVPSEPDNPWSDRMESAVDAAARSARQGSGSNASARNTSMVADA